MASDEFTEDEVLDDAVDSAVLLGLLTMQEVRTATDPSAAAELCLSAVSHIALAVTSPAPTWTDPAVPADESEHLGAEGRL
ncbi:hypothetical protein OG350_00760 [Streptomyces achromogenes]|uniref:Uncharacterized protein n=1 Tax=Streptomyces achromogenes TaxID=67255 RepID=A0ABZ1KE21_STRAH